MTKRSLILAGGGVKVAYQAGVLQVWLDEAGLTFDHADGASGGLFNLAMWAQGMTGTQIADNWRNSNPLMGVDPNWSEYVKLIWGESLFELDAYRKHVFPGWGLDWNKIRASDRNATFNVYNFSKHELRVLEAKEMSEDFLVAGVSLPMWFPPVRIDGDTYIDSVFNTDANLEEAIRRGADELWIVWTVSQRGEWHDGFIGNYFGIIEAAANGRYKQLLDKIERGEFGRPIKVYEIKAEVPMHYLINFSRDRVAEAVNRGVTDAREWCAQHGIALKQTTPVPPVPKTTTKLQFTEDMKGYAAPGQTEPQRGYDAGKENGQRLHAHMTIKVDDVNQFITEPQHEARIEGWVTSVFGEKRPIENGVFNLFVDAGDPLKKRMIYRFDFTSRDGEALTLSGEKLIEDDAGFDLWADTTTLFVRITGDNDAVRAAGIIRISLPDFMKQLTTFRTEGPTLGDRTAAMARFGAFFLGRLWDVYARQVIAYGPF